MQITTQEFKTEKGLLVTLEFADAMSTKITVQANDGEVLFSGDYDQADRLSGALIEIQHHANRKFQEDLEDMKDLEAHE